MIDFVSSPLFKKYISEYDKACIEGDCVASDIAFLTEACKRMQTSKFFSFSIVPRGAGLGGQIIIDWYNGSWDKEFVTMYLFFQSMRNAIKDDESNISEIAADLKEVTKHVGFNAVDAVCEFINSSYWFGKIHDKLKSLTST